MFLLYLIGILCSLVMFAPSIVPGFVKWPVAFLVVVLVVFFFNLSKKDTIYTTHDPKKRIISYGLFNPILMYISASSFVLGFSLIFTHLLEKDSTDLVGNLNNIVGSINVDFGNKLFLGLVLVVFAVLLYFCRNIFKNKAGSTGLICRSVWYIIFTIISLALGIYALTSFGSFDMFAHLEVGKNLFVYFGIIAAAVLIDLIGKWISHSWKNRKITREKRRQRKLAKIQAKKEKIDAKKAKIQYKASIKKAKKDAKLAKKEAKRAKKQAKKDAKLAKKEAKLAKKQAKIDAKLAKKEAKLAKKQAKLEKKNKK